MLKIIFSSLLMLVIISAEAQQNIIKVSTFKDVPKDMEGAGENLFLNKSDETAERFVFYTNYVRGLICVNNKMVLLTRPNRPLKKTEVFSNNDYRLIINYGVKKPTGDENYEIKSAILTLEYHSKVVWKEMLLAAAAIKINITAVLSPLSEVYDFGFIRM